MHELNFKDMYQDFSLDENEEIKLTVARGIHESITLLEKTGKNQFILGEAYMNMITFAEKDLELNKMMSYNFSESLGSFLRGLRIEALNCALNIDNFVIEDLKSDNAGDMPEIYDLNKSIIQNVHQITDHLYKANIDWRDRVRFYDELAKVVEDMPYTLITDTFDLFAETLISILLSGPDCTKRPAMNLLTRLVYFIPNTEKRVGILERMKTDFAQTNVSKRKNVFIDFVVTMMEVSSVEFYRKHFKEQVEVIKADSSSLVKVRFIEKMIPAINKYEGVMDQQVVMTLIATVDAFKFDKDQDTSNAAYDLDEVIKFNKTPSKEEKQKAEEREVRLKKGEQALIDREKFEFEDEERKKKEQEEEKFDIDALMAKARKNKKHYGGLSTKRHLSNINKLD